MPNQNGRRCRIAVVEDNDDLRMLFVLYLRRFHDTTAFVCGETFLAELESLKPDLIVLDITLPGADGFEVARRVRARRRFGHLPILFLTGMLAEDLELPEPARRTSVLHKPMTLEHLLECVERLLPKRGALVRRDASAGPRPRA